MLVKIKTKGNSHVLLMGCTNWYNYFGKTPQYICRKKRKANIHALGDIYRIFTEVKIVQI